MIPLEVSGHRMKLLRILFDPDDENKMRLIQGGAEGCRCSG